MAKAIFLSLELEGGCPLPSSLSFRVTQRLSNGDLGLFGVMLTVLCSVVGGWRDDTSWRTLLASTLRTPGADIRGVSSSCQLIDTRGQMNRHLFVNSVDQDLLVWAIWRDFG